MSPPVLSEPRVTIFIAEWYAAQDRARGMEPGALRDAALRLLDALEDGWATMRKLQRACDEAYRGGPRLPSRLLEAVFYALEIEVVDRYRAICSDCVASIPRPDGALPYVPLDDIEAESGVLAYMMDLLRAASPAFPEAVRALVADNAGAVLGDADEIRARAGALHDLIESWAETTEASRIDPISRAVIPPERRRVA